MKDLIFEIAENRCVANGVYKMRLVGHEISFGAGQFVQIALPCHQMPLRRPFCIYKAEPNGFTIIYAVVGKGTEVMAGLRIGEKLSILLPLGKGFDKFEGVVAAVGGGIGAAPLRQSLVEAGATSRAYLGFKDAENARVFAEDFAFCNLKITTEDASLGENVFPTDLLLRDINEGKVPDVIITCGPEPLMRAVKQIALQHNIKAYMTGESRMGCGYGACLVCACKVAGVYKRACADGPVFDLNEVDL